jgi:hypothetical protein
MVGDRQEFAAGRKAHVADPAERFVDGISRRNFQMRLRGCTGTNHRQRLAICGPVGPEDFVDHFPRSTASERNAGQSSRLTEGGDVRRMKGDGHLTLGGDGEDLRIWHAYGTGVGAVEAGGEDFLRLPFPGGAVDNGLAVGREAGGPNGAVAEGDFVESRIRKGDRTAMREAVNCRPGRQQE